MTTTFYPPYHLGGDAIHVYHLSNELAKRGHEVHVIHLLDFYYFKRKEKPKDRYENHENVFIHSTKSPLGNLSLVSAYVFGKSSYIDKSVEKVVKEVKPNVIHHHNISGFGPSILRYEAPMILYTAHDYWLICPMNDLMKYNGSVCNGFNFCIICPLLSRRPWQIWRYVKDINKIIKKVDTIITPSSYMKKKLQEFGIDKQIETLPNFVIKPAKSGELLYKYKFPYFLFVGVLERHKGILELVKVFIEIKDKIGAKLLIVGDGALKEKIDKIVVRNNCQDKIKLLGRIDNEVSLSTLYANALAVIIPSICPENNPLVALEALANGVPVVVSNQGGLPEIAEKIDELLIFDDFEELKRILLEFDKTKYSAASLINIYERYFSPVEYLKNYLKMLRVS